MIRAVLGILPGTLLRPLTSISVDFTEALVTVRAAISLLSLTSDMAVQGVTISGSCFGKVEYLDMLKAMWMLATPFI